MKDLLLSIFVVCTIVASHTFIYSDEMRFEKELERQNIDRKIDVKSEPIEMKFNRYEFGE